MEATAEKTVEINRIEYFAAQYLSHYLRCATPPFHRDIYAHLADYNYNRLVVTAPRYFAKSTVLSIIYTLYEICEGVEEEMQIFSASGGPGGLSTKWMKKIKKELTENPFIISEFGIEQGDTWSDEHIQVYRRCDGHTIDVWSKGKGSNPRGGRGIIIIDDPQGKKDVKSQTILAADEDWLFEDVLGIIDDKQRLIFIGTRMSPVSLLSTAAKTPNWKLLSYRAQDEKGDSIWPEKWSNEALQFKREEMGVDRYNSEYMDTPILPGNRLYREEWFKPYDSKSDEFFKLRQKLYRSTGLDPAISKKTTADFTGIVTLGATFQHPSDIYILDVINEHLTSDEAVDEIFNVYERMQQHKTRVESNAFQHVLYELIQKKKKFTGLKFPVLPINNFEDKATRAYINQPICQQGRVFYDPTVKSHVQLINQMMLFTGEDNPTFKDDLVDAFNMAMDELREWENRRVAQSGRKDGPRTRPYGNPVNPKAKKKKAEVAGKFSEFAKSGYRRG